jgi:hypothetical protein
MASLLQNKYKQLLGNGNFWQWPATKKKFNAQQQDHLEEFRRYG